MNELIEISRPLSYDANTGTYGVAETLNGLRRRLGRPATQTKTYSRTRVESKPPTPAMLPLLRAASASAELYVGKGWMFSTTIARAAERRGLGELIYEGERRHEVTGFKINAKGLAALATPLGKPSAADVAREVWAAAKRGA